MSTFAIQIIYRGHLDDPSLHPARLELVVLAARDGDDARALATELARHRELDDVVELSQGDGSLEFVRIRSVRQVPLAPPSSPILIGCVDDGPDEWNQVPDRAAQ